MLKNIFRGIVIGVFLSSSAFAAEYHVGPGQTYTNIGDVPWELLAAGDTAYIHAKPTPYLEKWVINRAGTAGKPVTVRGVPDANGVLPVIHGEGATTRSQLNYWNEERGILKIGGSNNPPDATPSHIVVENLHFRRARGQFTGRYGASVYADNAAGIYIEKGSNITVRNCTIEDNGNGIFVASATTNMVIEGNYIYGNGNVGSYYEHNTYTEARNILYQFNRFGPLCAGCGGNNLKDRSSGTVIRHNWIESGNRQLDLVDAEGSADIVNDPAYLQTFVYGNVLIEPEGAGNSQLVHFGGDSGTTADYRGTLYFWNNTVVSTRSGNTTLLRLSTNAQTAEVQNNIVYVTSGGSRLALSDSAGILHYGWNLFKPGFVNSHSGLTGSVTDLGGNVTAVSPGFVSEATEDFHLLESSPARNAAAPPPAAVAAYPLDQEYLKHQGSTTRTVDAPLDIGAFEYPTFIPGWTLNISRTGNGTVTSSPGGIDCGTQCSGFFITSATVTLSATPDTGGSIFLGWGGDEDCSDGVVLMNSDKICSAAFELCQGKPVSVGGVAYDWISDACDAAASIDTILLTAANLQETPDLAAGKTVTLDGGYNCSLTQKVSQTTITGLVTVTSGSVSFDGIVIR